MDLKSMLNDAAAQRPSVLHTPHSSYDSRVADKTSGPDSRSQSRSHSQSNRPLHYPPPLQPVDSRGQTGGGYFGFQSPHQGNVSSASTHASTPSVGPQSVYARSPGAQSQPFTPRESVGPPSAYSNNPSFVPSPSLSVTQPPTPGSNNYQYQNHTPSSAHGQAGIPLSFAQAQSPRGSNPSNGQPRQISPHVQHNYPHPATPLGPPPNYLRNSPQAQRPTSQGVELHHRKSSHGSVGSIQSKEHNPGQPLLQPDLVRAESTPRQSIPDLDRVKERDRSISVSPKTIPLPSPYRHLSVNSQTGSQGRLSLQSPPGDPTTKTVSGLIDIQTVETKSEYQQTPTPRSSTLPQEPQTLSRGPSIKQETPEMTSSPAAPANLKRNASFMSDQSQNSQQQQQQQHQPPRKRLKGDAIPIFAQSSRRKPVRFGTGGQRLQSTKLASRPPPAPPASAPASALAPAQQPAKTGPAAVPNGKKAASESNQGNPVEGKWEPSIANITPYEDLTRRVCDWIYHEIGMAVPPSGGAMFEIEAKIGEIVDIESRARLSLPVESETVLSKGKKRIKFESSMNIEQHMQLNVYLNELTQEAYAQAQRGERQEILYDHPREVDEFFDLTQEGRQNLNPSIQQYLNPHRGPRIRRTRDSETGQLKAQIIKSRIADLEIYNPSTDFDYRISISIESPWEGDPNWLIPRSDGMEGRNKDRVSYRHMAYQVDLTQVSHDNQPSKEHELEVEISTEQVRRELDNLANGRPSKYEDLIRGLLDNVRLLCRKGSLPR